MLLALHASLCTSLAQGLPTTEGESIRYTTYIEIGSQESGVRSQETGDRRQEAGTRYVSGICILHRGPENKISPISAAEAMEMLLAQGYCPPESREKFLALTEKLANTVPLWSMECTKDAEAPKVSHNAMSNA